MKLNLFLLVIILVTGCAPMGSVPKLMPALSEDEIDMRRFLIGKWGITLDTKDGGKRRELAIMKADGTFKFTFTNLNKNDEIEDEYSLVGMWGLVNNIHFTIALGQIAADGRQYKKDTTDPHNYDAYEVLELNNSIFKYRSLVNNIEYSLIKFNEGGMSL